jgi:hypothetical protein
MISLLIGFSKRYAELSNHSDSKNHRKALELYSTESLKAFVVIMASSTIVTYALYTLSPRSIELHHTTNLIYTTPIVMFGIFRFLHLVLCARSGEEPASQLFKDRLLVFTIVFWVLTYGLIIS